MRRMKNKFPNKNYFDIKQRLDRNAAKNSKIGNIIQLGGLLMADGYDNEREGAFLLFAKIDE